MPWGGICRPCARTRGGGTEAATEAVSSGTEAAGGGGGGGGGDREALVERGGVVALVGVRLVVLLEDAVLWNKWYDWWKLALVVAAVECLEEHLPCHGPAVAAHSHQRRSTLGRHHTWLGVLVRLDAAAAAAERSSAARLWT